MKRLSDMTSSCELHPYLLHEAGEYNEVHCETYKRAYVSGTKCSLPISSLQSHYSGEYNDYLFLLFVGGVTTKAKKHIYNKHQNGACTV